MITDNKKFYTAKYDRVFKSVLCDEDNPYLLQEFLSRLLKKKVSIVEFLRNELPVNNSLEKVKTVDVLVKVDDEYIHIEINVGIPSYLHIRNFIYFSTIYSRKVQRGEIYDYKTQFIHFDFTYGIEDNEEDYIEYCVQSDRGEKYVPNIKIIEYNMDKIMEYWYNKNIPKVNEYKHLIMLDLETKGLKKLSEGDGFVGDFEKKLTNLNEQETFQSAMTYEEDQKLILNTEKKISFEEGVSEGITRGISQGISQGITRGISQGITQRNKEIAKNFLKLGTVSIEDISKATGLTVEEINRLQNID